MTTGEAAESDRERWDRRYAGREGPAHFRPRDLLVQHHHLLAETVRRTTLPDGSSSSGPRALDVACGFGGNSLYLASMGYQVEAVDVSGVALAQAQAEAARRGLQLGLIQADLTRWRVWPSRYDLIVVSYYLNRDLIPQLSSGLRPGGLLFVETWNVGHLSERPQFNPEFLLRHGELRRLARDAGLDAIHAVDGMPRPHSSQLVARRPG